MLCSTNIIRYHRRNSKGFSGTQLINSRPAHPPFFTFLMSGFVYTASTVLSSEGCCCTGQQPSFPARPSSNHTVLALKVLPEHMLRSAASTALEPEGCGC